MKVIGIAGSLRANSNTLHYVQTALNMLEEEGLEDRDYAITPMTLSLFEGEGADPVLVSMLRSALGNREEMSIIWEEEK